MGMKCHRPVLLAVSLGLIFSGCVGLAKANSCAPIESLSRDQVRVLSYAYYTGAQEDLGLTMAAIAWHESYAGKIIVGDKGKSFGAYHVMATTSMWMNGTRDSFDNFNREATKLLDLQYGSGQALKYLVKMRDKTTTWKGMVTSYNGGSSYYYAVKPKLKLLDKCRLYWLGD